MGLCDETRVPLDVTRQGPFDPKHGEHRLALCCLFACVRTVRAMSENLAIFAPGQSYVDLAGHWGHAMSENMVMVFVIGFLIGMCLSMMQWKR